MCKAAFAILLITVAAPAFAVITVLALAHLSGLAGHLW
jgi:hypothetical protein